MRKYCQNLGDLTGKDGLFPNSVLQNNFLKYYLTGARDPSLQLQITMVKSAGLIQHIFHLIKTTHKLKMSHYIYRSLGWYNT